MEVGIANGGASAVEIAAWIDQTLPWLSFAASM